MSVVSDFNVLTSTLTWEDTDIAQSYKFLKFELK